MTELIISTKRDHDLNFNKRRKIELNKLKMDQIHNLIKKYGITEIHERKILKAKLIDGIILYEKMSLGGKQTQLEINIDGEIKSYFVETNNNLILVKKMNTKNMGIINTDDTEIYDIYNYLFEPSISHKQIYRVDNKNEKTRFRFNDCICKNKSSILEDVEICHKAICFIDSFYFYLKIKYLSGAFNEINDIIRNICFIYFDRTLQNVSNIRCKLV